MRLPKWGSTAAKCGCSAPIPWRCSDAMIDFETLARPGIRDLRAYDPGHDLISLRRRFAEAQLVELGSNENPSGASPLARQAVIDAFASIHIDTDPLGRDPKRALAARPS